MVRAADFSGISIENLLKYLLNFGSRRNPMNQNIQELIQSQAKKAKSAMRVLSRSSADVRNNALLAMAENLQHSKDKIQEANRIDLKNGEKTGLAAPLHATPPIGRPED